jgi:hypothetical protein
VTRPTLKLRQNEFGYYLWNGGKDDDAFFLTHPGVLAKKALYFTSTELAALYAEAHQYQWKDDLDLGRPGRVTILRKLREIKRILNNHSHVTNPLWSGEIDGALDRKVNKAVRMLESFQPPNARRAK